VSESAVTRQGIENAKPDRDAVVGGRHQGTRRGRRGRGEQPMVPGAEFASYYGQSVINPPVWKWPIPTYFFTGGLAAGSSLLGFGATLTGNAALRRHSRYAAFGALLVSTACLVEDLGKPSRFHHMLRVVKVTSPMSVGTWILSSYAVGAGGAAVSEYTGRVRWLGHAAGGWAALMAPALGTYTAVLVADTAVPVWHAERDTLPFTFAGSAMAAAGGLAAALNRPADAAPARRFAVTGAVLELASSQIGERRVGRLGEVYHEGTAGALTKAALACSATGAALLGLLGRRRPGAIVGGALLVAGSALTRFSVFEAGMQSSRDPAYTVEPQRERIKQRESEGHAGRPHISSADDTRRVIGDA
jgi:hypothetical protein